MKTRLILSDLGIVCNLGKNKAEVLNNLIAKQRFPLTTSVQYLYTGSAQVGLVNAELSSLEGFPSHYQSRNNAIAELAYRQIGASIQTLLTKIPAKRLGVVIGTSTSSIGEGELARSELLQTGKYATDYHYYKQEFVAPAHFIAELSGAQGPCYAISTACSSSAKAFSSAGKLIESGLVDAVIVGGVDSLCQLTLNGFAALASTSKGLCQPFSQNRDGINIGEGAGIFVICKETLSSSKQQILLMGTGESSDAHHISAPHPDGDGAVIAIQNALKNAQLNASEVDYINLHGTGTQLNDLMEAKALTHVFESVPKASSTKSITGHTLGASGALEVGFCWLLLSKYNKDCHLPIHHFDGQYDDQIPPISLVSVDNSLMKNIDICMSNSFAFGGSNACVIIGKSND